LFIFKIVSPTELEKKMKDYFIGFEEKRNFFRGRFLGKLCSSTCKARPKLARLGKMQKKFQKTERPSLGRNLYRTGLSCPDLDFT
jgi:hypothetical protein